MEKKLNRIHVCQTKTVTKTLIVETHLTTKELEEKIKYYGIDEAIGEDDDINIINERETVNDSSDYWVEG